ncbi:MAG TPA: cytidine deaminase [Chryseosolibacter sp.]|nr:cytidine deaminase [Chryseosolibacter sp.]
MNEFKIIAHLEDLDLESKYLVHKAKDASTHAYAPYSKFLVGCAILLKDGTVVTGTNQENAAYPSGMCAERVALYNMISGHENAVVTKMAVVARKKSHKELSPATSCGACRQVMLEFEERQGQPIEIVMLSQEHQWIIAPSAHSLLPFSFTGASLDHEKH